MNETVTNVIIESVISPAVTPERLVMEHVLLVALLHSNVGTEVGKIRLNAQKKYFRLLACKV